jgi:hypothetical protein
MAPPLVVLFVRTNRQRRDGLARLGTVLLGLHAERLDAAAR